MQLSNAEYREIDELKSRLPPPDRSMFSSPKECHHAMLDEVFGPCLQQAKIEGCFPSEKAFLRMSLSLWREVFSNYCPKESA